MKPLLVCFLASFCLAGSVVAQRLDWKPDDFAPLTQVPWDDEKLSMPAVLKALFQEPNVAVRYPMLAEYLRAIPVSELEPAVRLSIVFEGTQHPRELVRLFLIVWVERDPEGAWQKAKSLLASSISHRVLGLARWDLGKVTVANREAFQESTFWINPEDVAVIAPLIEASKLSKESKTRILKEFAGTYVELAGALPHDNFGTGQDSTHYGTKGENLGRILRRSSDWILEHFDELPAEGPIRQSGLVRCLQQRPHQALELLERSRKGEVSQSFLWRCAKLDQAAMTAWTADQDPRTSTLGMEARGMLLGRVDETTSARWLAAAAQAGYLPALCGRWAEWAPGKALAFGATQTNAQVLAKVLTHAAYPSGGAYNRSHFGLGVLRDFDLDTVQRPRPGDQRSGLPDGWGIVEMERWLEIDVGEAARHAFALIASPHFVEQYPKQKLIEVFSGQSLDSDDDGLLDRAFCGLRFWATWKPDEMRKWIGTLSDPEMQKALIWTLEHPWGWDASEGKVRK